MRASLFVLLFAVGCDSKAVASDPPSMAPRPEEKSKEYESCGASMHCAGDLRCFANTCRRSARSTVGDYFAAVGAAARTRGDLETSIAAYASALGHYDSEKIVLPPDVDCAYGGALAAAKTNRDHAELGARVLHRCILAVPVGSWLRDKALAELATLSDSGLDPLLVGAQKTGDLYLTKGPAQPATDKLTVSVTADPQPAKSFPLITTKLAEPDFRNALVTCWDQHQAATKKTVLSSVIAFKSSYIAPEYEDEPGRYVLKFDPPIALAPGPESTADACVRQIVSPAIESLKLREGFTTKLTITVK
ncbi:MAG: hypothetical protein JWP01_3202 [Myxococcales bacterium]|nr:hypothetical protein [Myxococcales bacterium]